MNVKAIKLGFENVEAVTFPMEDVVHLYFGDIKKQISSFSHMYVMESEIAYEFYMQVNKRGNVPEAYASLYEDGERFPFNRVIAYPDITSVDLQSEDGSVRTLYVDWKEEPGTGGCNNIYQTSVISEANGDLFIVVNAKENVESAFGGNLDDEEPFYRRLLEMREAEGD